MYIREVTASTVQELGLEPVMAADGATALSMYQEHRNSICLAIIDIVMPTMNGDQLLRELRSIDPNLPAIMVSGFTDRTVLDYQAGPHTEFVQKPFHPEELIAAVRRVLPVSQ
jgi:DNA-binding NtrC family response regulator